MNETEQFNSNVKSVLSICKFGMLTNPDLKSQNKWVVRMLKAGFPTLHIPENWDELDEEQKSMRLNLVILELEKVLAQNGQNN